MCGACTLHARVVKETGLVIQNTIRVTIKPQRLWIATHNANLALVFGGARVAQNLKYDNAVLAALQARDRFVSDRAHFRLALVVGNGKSRVTFNAGQTLLRFIQDFPHGLNGRIEGAVSNDVATTEEVVILAARALEFALQNTQCVGSSLMPFMIGV